MAAATAAAGAPFYCAPYVHVGRLVAWRQKSLHSAALTIIRIAIVGSILPASVLSDPSLPPIQGWGAVLFFFSSY